jgi:hypothetical protein
LATPDEKAAIVTARLDAQADFVMSVESEKFVKLAQSFIVELPNIVAA